MAGSSRSKSNAAPTPRVCALSASDRGQQPLPFGGLWAVRGATPKCSKPLSIPNTSATAKLTECFAGDFDSRADQAEWLTAGFDALARNGRAEFTSETKC
jgi:hypothetical protein